THLVFGLDDGGELRFRDVRRFGSAALFAGRAALDEFLDERLGPEPFELQPEPFHAALKATARPLKAALLDQKLVAGVGNIYADEALLAAKLHPARRGADTTRPQAERLRAAVVAVLERAIGARGSTIRDYVGGSGERGGYQEEFCVYGRAGQPCPRCGAAV